MLLTAFHRVLMCGGGRAGVEPGSIVSDHKVFGLNALEFGLYVIDRIVLMYTHVLHICVII